MLATLAVENYRSLRHLVLPLGRLNVVTGANGTGKSNLYRALRLLADSSRNGAVPALAREGGLPSTLWAGPEKISQAVRAGEHPVQGTRRSMPVSLRLGFAGDEFGYAVDFGLPEPTPSAFSLDPEIKRECTWSGPLLRPAAMLTDRRGGVVRIRDDDGSWLTMHDAVRSYDSMLSEFADPQVAPDLLSLRERIRSWRFYDHVRTDAQAPARATQIGTRTPVLGHDGATWRRRCRPSGRSATSTPSTRRSITPFRAAASRWSARAVGSTCCCISTDCCDRSPAASCPTARCASCCGPPHS